MRLTPLAWAGVSIALVGFALRVYAETQNASALVTPSTIVALIGFALYLIARVRMVRSRRRGGDPRA